MKLCRVKYQGTVYTGRLVDGIVITDATDVLPSIEIAETELRFLPPVSPSKIVCVGRNYADHAAELGNEVPKAPLLFLKAPSAVITEGDSIRLPRFSQQVEHEAELGIVIGRTCADLGDGDDPFPYVRGYLAVNDVTARDLQKADGQFARAKSFDTFCPIGRVIETDLDPADLEVTCLVNGQVRQQGRTSQMVFSVPYLIRYVSQMMTLLPGDIIATGTPSGVSKLNPGDVCEVSIEGMEPLRNSVA